MTTKGELTPHTSKASFNEIKWKVLMSNKNEYVLSSEQMEMLKKAISVNNRGILVFDTFAISIPYITDFYLIGRNKRKLFDPTLYLKKGGGKNG